MCDLFECPKCLIKPNIYEDEFGRTVIKCPKCGRKIYGAGTQSEAMYDWDMINRISKIHLDDCPFCGGEGRVERFALDEFVIECQKCWCRTQVEDTPEEAAEKWNRRKEV